MNRVALILVSLSMLTSMSACGMGPAPKVDSDINDYIEKVESGGSDLSDLEKSFLATDYPRNLELSSGESFTLELPYEAAEISYTSDDNNIATVSDDGVITPIGAGECIIHTKADDMMLHTIVVVDADETLSKGDKYVAYTKDGFSADTIEQQIETYASAKCGFTVIDSLKNGEPVEEDTFTFAYEHTGCEVYNKLLTTVDALKLDGYEKIAVKATITDEQIVCQFFAE